MDMDQQDTLHRSARKFGERTAAIEGAQRIDYTQLDAASNQFAHHLLASALGAGDKIAMICNNSIQSLIAAYGILKAGLVWVPVNTMLAAADVRYILEHAEVVLVVIDDSFTPIRPCTRCSTSCNCRPGCASWPAPPITACRTRCAGCRTRCRRWSSTSARWR
jgi:acyl-CoA synthetase (AMP-forming)/AMP-acid ligase II